MNTEDFEALVFERYNVRADYPFPSDSKTAVLRNRDGKWFAILMRVSERKPGKSGDMQTTVVNLKCSPEIIESIVGVEREVYHAYHMNKVHWLSLDISECDNDTCAWLLGISYTLVETTGKRLFGR